MKTLKSLPILWKVYYETDEWKTKRKMLFEDRGYKCEICGNINDLQAHHKSYENLFDEKLEDLQCLCSRCHRCHHNNNILTGIHNAIPTIKIIDNFEKLVNKHYQGTGPRKLRSPERIAELKKATAQRKLDRAAKNIT